MGSTLNGDRELVEPVGVFDARVLAAAIGVRDQPACAERTEHG
jgi:hypothetical protein